MPREPRAARAREALARLRRTYPPRHAFLHHETPFQLLVAVILSARYRDARVNALTPALFAAYPDAARLARAEFDDVLALIRPATYAPSKARRLIAAARMVEEEFGGRLPRRMADLVRLPGVGRKSASVVQGYVWGEAEAVAVDTHVGRVAYRLGLTGATQADAASDRLGRLYPRRAWPDINYFFIQHGRAVCRARRPLCGDCVLADLCPKVGVTSMGSAPVGSGARKPVTAKGGRGATSRPGKT